MFKRVTMQALNAGCSLSAYLLHILWRFFHVTTKATISCVR